MPHLNLDILFDIVSEIDSFGKKDRRDVLANLSAACHVLNDAIRPILFREVTWPHPDKHDKETGLHFFPEVLWPYFHKFHLDWPDHWPDVFPPLWGTKPLGRGVYHPKHLDKLERALRKMSNIGIFQITCPFYPTTSLLAAIVGCPNIKDIRIIDTPIFTGLLPSLPDDFRLERMTLVAVAEALRIGEGPHNKKYQDLSFYTREYRKRHGSDTNVFFAGHQYLSQICRIECLRYLQVSSKYTRIDLLATAFWPNLETLVLTGAPFEKGWRPLIDAIDRMPKLFDLRLLFAKTNRTTGDMFLVLSDGSTYYSWDYIIPHPRIFSRIRHLALSNAYNFQDLLRHTTSLDRLSVSAIIAHPRIPIALSRQEINKILEDLAVGGGNEHLKRIRLMTEDALDFGLFEQLGNVCPELEFVEVELCGYREGESGFEWTDYGDALATYQHLRELRIGIPFAGCDDHDDHDPKECLRSDRRDCGSYIASRVPTLRRIGFEYRTRTGSHRHEDRWLDFDIIRLDDGNVRLCELGQSWYPFPEVWDAVPLHE